MEIKQALEFVDALICAQVGKPLDDLERAIFRGAWEGQTYSEIASSYHCSEGHVKDMGARLWEQLSIALNTQIHKKNFRGAVEQAFEHASEQQASEQNLPIVTQFVDANKPLAAPCPFVAGPMLTNPQAFVGRQLELEMITSRMIGVQPISINLVGDRRIGKSSLLYHFARTWVPQIQSPCTAIYLSLREAHCQRRLSFYQAVARKLLQHAKVQAHPELIAPLQTQPFDDEAFAIAMEGWRDRGVLPVLCLDEFEALLQYPQEFHDGFYDSLRFLMDFNALMLIVASKQRLEIYRDNHRLTSSFFNLGHMLPLSELTDTEAQVLVSQQAALTLEEQQTALVWGGRHPYRLQMAGCCLWEARQQQREIEWARERFDQQLHRAVREIQTASLNSKIMTNSKVNSNTIRLM